MTPEQVALVEQTALPDAAAARFYALLFAARPDLRALFPDDLVAQEAAFAASLRLLVEALRDHPGLAARCRRQGARHAAYGVKPGHYALVGGVLLAALADVLWPDWDAEREQAWAAAWSLTAELMMSGAGTPAP